jgi:hypothetical protein
MKNPFKENLPEPQNESDGSDTNKSLPVPEQNGSSSQIIDRLPESTRASLTPAQRDGLQQYSDSMKFGIAGVSPMICADQQCPYFAKCPLVRQNVPRPTGQDCPVEEFNQARWISQWTDALGIDISDVNMSAYDMLLLNDLGVYQTLEARATMELALDPSIMIQSAVAVDPKSGRPIMKRELNPLIGFKEKIAKIKQKLLKEMIATRKAKADDAKHAYVDRSAQAAALIDRARKILDDNEARTIDADYVVKEDDDDGPTEQL